MEYILMHRTKETARIELDEFSNIASIYEVYDSQHLPVGTVQKEVVNKRALAKWWSGRSIPASRQGLKEALQKLGMTVSQELLDKCYGLSLSDQYWILPKGERIAWEAINFFDHSFSEDVGNLLFGHGSASESMSLVSPDNTSDGQLMKKWKIADGKRILMKGSSKPYYQEALCEVIASRIAGRLGINHVEYSVIWENEEPFSLCEDFITRDTELISASHIMNAFKKPNNLSEYEYYIQCAEKLGVSNIRKEVEKMIVLDFIIANEDRHFNNFGLVRNAVTLEWIGAAPIFDCGTSLWYNTQESRIKPLAPSLQGKPFKKTHAEQIHLVKDFSWIDLSALDGVEEEADAIFAQSEYLSDARRNILVNAIRDRINLLGELI